MSPAAATLVFGPAYLDRVIRVDGPLLDPSLGWPPLDRSVDGDWLTRDNGHNFLSLVDPLGRMLRVEVPSSWPGAVGMVALSRPLFGPEPRQVRGLTTVDDLGGMGAGFAASLGGMLVSALGDEDDPTTRAIVALLERAGIAHEPSRVADHPADWTLLISSGVHGDKLPVGFRVCHAAWTDLSRWAGRASRVRVVAALPNRLACEALGGGPAEVRAFFPNSRNMLDRAEPVAGFAHRFDVLSCNQGEWDDLGDGASALALVPVVAITDGPRGATVRFQSPAGESDQIEVPAFPRVTPIADTNHAGEAFAATLLATLVEAGWTPGPASPDLVRRAAWRGSAASGLVLGRTDFGFPTATEIDEAVRRGVV